MRLGERHEGEEWLLRFHLSLHEVDCLLGQNLVDERSILKRVGLHFLGFLTLSGIVNRRRTRFIRVVVVACRIKDFIR